MLKETIQTSRIARKITIAVKDDGIKENAVYYHVFTLIDLVEVDMQDGLPESSEPFRYKKSHKNKRYKVYAKIDRIHINKSFFDDISQNLTIGDEKLNLFSNKYVAVPQSLYQHYIVQENSDDCGFNDFFPSRTCPIYVNTYIDEERSIEALFEQNSYLYEQLENVCLQMQLHPFVIRKHHLGNIYVLSYHPAFRAFHFTIGGNGSNLIVTVNKRNAQHEYSYRVQVEQYEQHHFLIGYHEFTIENGENCKLVPLPFPITCPRIKIFDNLGRLVYDLKNLAMMRVVYLNTSTPAHTLIIKNKQEKLRVQKHRIQRQKITNKPNLDFSLYYHKHFTNCEHYGNENDFVFIEGKQNDTDRQRRAVSFIQGVLGKAQHVCYICDPYFDGDAFYKYVMTLQDVGVQIRILTTGSNLKNKTLPVFLHNLKEYVKIYGEDCVKIRLFRADKLKLHDRFVIVDNQAWHVGSSLNHFGNKGTAASRIPERYRNLIINSVEKWWNSEEDTTSLEDYIKDSNM